MKRSLLALLALCAISSTGFAQTNTADGTWLYTVNGNSEATLVGLTDIGVAILSSESGFEVPEYLDSYPLKTIGPNAFSRLAGSPYYEGIRFTGVTGVEAIPEPSTYALLILSGAASLWALKRRKS